MLDSYRAVLTLPGALSFSLAGLLGRLPISMIGLGLVLLVQHVTGSYGAAGVVSAAYVLGNAAFAVVGGRLIDRYGQSRVLPIAMVISCLALAGTVAVVVTEQPAPLPHLLAALAGATMPQVGSCVRARWASLLNRDGRLHTAFSYEAVMDETVFILGPTLVTVLATAWHPVAGLVTAIVCGLIGGLGLAAQRSTEPPTRPATRRGEIRIPMPWALLAILIGVSAMLGAVFGGAEVATVAFADEQGRKAWAGPLLGIWAFGSLLAGLAFGAASFRIPRRAQFQRAATALGVSLVPPPFLGSVWLLGPVLLLAGLAISPTLITLTGLVEEHVPAPRLTEGLAVVHSGMAFGVALGAAVVGYVVDHAGASASYGVVITAGAIGAILAWTLPDRSAPDRRTPPLAEVPA